MVNRISALGDRLLARIVPHARAAAVQCWYDYGCMPISSPCFRRYCCQGQGIPGIQCTDCRPCS